MATEIWATASSGRVQKDGSSGEAYSLVHDAVEGSDIYTGTILIRNYYYSTYNRYIISRGFGFFEVPNIEFGVVKIKFWAASKGEADAGHSTLHIVEGVQSDPLTLADYGNHKDKIISGGSIAYTDIVVGDWNYITLNDTGKSWIVIGGVTKLCFRLAGDINTSTPTANNYVNTSGTDGRPYCYLVLEASKAGYIWCSDEVGETTELHYIDEAEGERAIEGATTGQTGTAGHLWIEGTYLHYIDSNGDERRQEGTQEGATGQTAGHLWLEGSNLRYIDSNGDERYITGT